MTKVLITGAQGQLGKCIQDRVKDFPGMDFIFTDISELDITNNKDVHHFINDNKIDIVVNCAAYTAVDKAEEDSILAMKINGIAVRNLALAIAGREGKMIQISTDYVFDGTKDSPYLETDVPCPTSIYGKTKLSGEMALLQICPDSIVLRTAWLYSEYGHNFVKTMKRLGAEKEELNVVSDQKGSPTYAGDLASAILTIINAKEFIPGIYHFTNEGECSWFDFATKIMQLAQLPCKVNPIETKDYPTPANRPLYSVLNKSKIKQTYGIQIPHWEESLTQMMK